MQYSYIIPAFFFVMKTTFAYFITRLIDWEQRKLRDVANIVGGGTPSTSNEEFWNGDIDWYSPAEIGEQRYLYESQKKITELGLQKSSAKILPVGTVLFTSRAGIGNTAILAKEAATNQGFQSIVPKSNLLDSYFIYSKTGALKRYGEVTGAGSTFVEVSGKQMEKMPILIPSLAEQIKIGEFFKRFDNSIALHQRKLEALQQLKKSFLQKIFLQSQGKTPQIRFVNFHEEWEQRKVMDMSEETYGGGTPRTNNKEYWQGNFPWIQSSDLKNDQLCNVIPTKFITNEAISESATKAIPSNSIAIVTRVGVGKLALIPYDYATSQDFLSLSRLTVEPWFGVYSLYKLLKKEINNIQGTSIKGITKSDLLEKKINLPTSLVEQNKIGAFFKKLDSTLALHQSKLENLQSIKDSLLQKMFL